MFGKLRRAHTHAVTPALLTYHDYPGAASGYHAGLLSHSGDGHDVLFYNEDIFGSEFDVMSESSLSPTPISPLTPISPTPSLASINSASSLCSTASYYSAPAQSTRSLLAATPEAEVVSGNLLDYMGRVWQRDKSEKKTEYKAVLYNQCKMYGIDFLHNLAILGLRRIVVKNSNGWHFRSTQGSLLLMVNVLFSIVMN